MNKNEPTPLHLNNTGRIIFNTEAAKKLERLSQPKHMTMTKIDGDFRLAPVDRESEDTLEISYKKAPYTSDASQYFEPFGFKKGTGNPSYPLDAVWDGIGFRFPNPLSKKGKA